MLRVHVRLDLEDEGGEFLGRRINHHPAAFARGWRWRELEETVEQELHAEVVRRAAEEDGRELAGEDFFQIELRARAFEQFQLVADLLIGSFLDRILHALVLDARHRHRGAIGAVNRALEKMHLLLLAIINPAEARAVAERPVDRIGVDAEHGFQLVKQVHRRPGRAVELVHEGENRHAPAAADFEEFPRLTLDALARVHHHHGGVHGG